MTAVDIGCAMGFFSLPLARMVGPTGRVICVDVQQRMLSSLEKRARRKGLHPIVETRLCSQEDLGLNDLRGSFDLALAVHVAHETAYPRRFFSQTFEALRPGGRLLLIEPNGHVSNAEFDATRHMCGEVGLDEIELTRLRRSTALLLERPSNS
jgi:2-polyprenyl-3-methyl-5-hydroxy-6-metoxy-1,4-benzoquinol methylase